MSKNRHRKKQTLVKPDVNVSTYTDKNGRGKTVITFRNGTDEFIEFAYVNIKVKDGCMFFEKGNVDSGGVRLNNTAHHIQCSNQNMQSVFRTFNGDYPLSITDSTCTFAQSNICYIKLSERVAGSEPKAEPKAEVKKPDTSKAKIEKAVSKGEALLVVPRAGKSIIGDETLDTALVNGTTIITPENVEALNDDISEALEEKTENTETAKEISVPENPEYDKECDVNSVMKPLRPDIKEIKNITVDMEKKRSFDDIPFVKAVKEGNDVIEKVMRKGEEIEAAEKAKNVPNPSWLMCLKEVKLLISGTIFLMENTEHDFENLVDGSSIPDIIELLNDAQKDVANTEVTNATISKIKVVMKLIDSEDYVWHELLGVKESSIKMLTTVFARLTGYIGACNK